MNLYILYCTYRISSYFPSRSKSWWICSKGQLSLDGTKRVQQQRCAVRLEASRQDTGQSVRGTAARKQNVGGHDEVEFFEAYTKFREGITISVALQYPLIKKE